jgi:SAM-dependent methyltransferase
MVNVRSKGGTMPIRIMPKWFHPMFLPSNLILSGRQALKERGLIYTLLRAVQIPQRVLIGYYTGLAGRAFDRRHGTATSEIVEFPGHLISGNNQQYGYSYVPTPPKIFHRIIQSLDICFSDFTFIDFGSGKGRVVMLALEYGFKKVVGVEYSITLHDAAANNVQIFQTNRSGNLPMVELFCSDAAKFKFSRGNKILYFFNPFSEKVMGLILDNLSAITRTESPFPTIYLIHVPLRKWSLDIFVRNSFLLTKRLRITDYTGMGRDVLIFQLMPPSRAPAPD